MDLLVEKLEDFGLEYFIDAYRFPLCRKTVSPRSVAVALNFDAVLIEDITHPPDNFSKCEKLYEYITKRANEKNFLEALEETGNDHILKFIKNTVFLTRGIWFNIPEPIDSFCGREDFLSHLHDHLKPRDDSETEVTVLSQFKIVSGLGGIGKTETARKYIMKHRKFYNNFIWIDAETENSIINSFLKLAEEIKINTKNSEGKPREVQQLVKEIYNKICEGQKSTLIVFDSAEDYQSCRQFFPFGLHPDLTMPVILATSRNQEWKSTHGKIRVLALDRLTEDESLEFILKQLEIPESDIAEFREESKEFIQLIDGHPLALQQAVAYIKQEKELKSFFGMSYKISDYVKEFKLSMKKFQSFSPVPVPDSSPTVFVTWNVTFEKIQKLANGEEAIKILEILSFLHAHKIPVSFLRDLVPEIEPREFTQALQLLRKYSLIKMNDSDFSMSIHPQLQFVVLQYLKKSNEISGVVLNLVERFRMVLQDIQVSDSRDVVLNVQQFFNNQFDSIPITKNLLDFMSTFADVLDEAGFTALAVKLYRRVTLEHGRMLAAQQESDKMKTYNCDNVRVLFINQKFDSATQSLNPDYTKWRRLGAEFDRPAIENLFQDTMNMTLEVEENVPLTKIRKILKRFKQNCIDDKNDGCIVIIGTHGSYPHNLLMDDLDPINSERDVVQQFGRDKFKEFDGKPKVFIFNACRNDMEIKPKTPELVPDSIAVNYSDFLIVYSTMPFHKSWRYEEKGSCFIQTLCEICLEKMDQNVEFRQVIHMVARKVAEAVEQVSEVQVAEIRDWLFEKKFYLQPQ